MSLVPRLLFGDLDLTDYPYSLEFGGDLGNAENQAAVITSLLADGEIESLTRRSNRTIVVTILVEGADLAAVAAAEAALIAECDKQRNALTFDPGDGLAAVTVFDTFAAQPERAYDDDMEVALLRRWRLTIRALPYGRSEVATFDDAGTPPLSGGTLLYNCESTTGWGEWGGGTLNSPTVDSVIFTEGAGSLRTQARSAYITTGSHYVYFYWLSYSIDQVTGLSLDTDTGGYLSIAVRIEYSDVIPGLVLQPGLEALHVQVDGGAWEEVTSFVAARRDDENFVHYVWPVDAGLNVTGLRMGVRQIKWDNSGSGTGGFAHNPYTWYDDVELLPSATTDHQIVKQLTVGGSARTSASLRVAAPSEVVPLGNVLAITVSTAEIPAGFQPDGRRWVVQGDTTVDATALHGSYFTPDTDYSDATGTPDRPVFDVPVAGLTAGPYTMVGAIYTGDLEPGFGVRAQLRIDGTDVGPTSEAEVTPQGLSGWQFVPVGTVYLPPLPMQGADSTAKVRLLFKGAKMADVYFIPAWEVGGRPVADFSIVDCGSGTVEAGGASSSLWLDAPSLSQPQGGIWRGPLQERTGVTSAWPDAKVPGVHTFAPGGLTAFLVSTGAAGPTLRLEYFKAWAGLAAEE